MVALRDAYIIGQENFEAWSEGFDEAGYLKVLPHPDVKVPFKDPFKDWQQGRPGNYFSSWGPDEVLDIEMTVEDIDEIQIEGLGTLEAGDGIIPWFPNNDGDPTATPYENLRGYNGMIPGPMLIVEPGDTLDIELSNQLMESRQAMNFHLHGGHVSAKGYADNVLIAFGPGESWNVEIPIPENHFIGTDWYHPHVHGVTNEQVLSGIAGPLIMLAPEDTPDLDKFDPTTESLTFMTIQSFGLQQINRSGDPNDPVNQDPNVALPAATPVEILGQTAEGLPIYELSDAPYMGYNAFPALYDPAQPLGGEGLFEYGGGPLLEPVENVIHTVNSQYNPTIELETNEWHLFSMLNASPNSFFITQVVKEEGDELIPQEVTLVAIDGDASGVVTDNRREVRDLPILNSGSRISFQEQFTEEGTYYILGNPTEELVGAENTPTLLQGKKGFDDGHLIWGPQVLATIEVTDSQANPEPQPFPEVYDFLVEQAQEVEELVELAREGIFNRERTFYWGANLGGAIANGNDPEDTEVESFEGTYTINDEYFSTQVGGGMPPLSLLMMDAVEKWTVVNESGLSNPNLPEGVPDIPLLEWHPFHIHQNDFILIDINGVPVEEIDQNYLANVLSDTIALPPTHEPGSVTPENPYGIPQFDGIPGEVTILMRFEDFPGSYVNHCHILFHEDAGMMAVVRVIPNTNVTWLGLPNLEGDDDGTTIELMKADNFRSINLLPYGDEFTSGVDVAIADVNYLGELENQYVTDNIPDVVTVQSDYDPDEELTVKVFDGKTLIDKQSQRVRERLIDGNDAELLIGEFTPFEDIDVPAGAKVDLAAADINSDGFAEIVVSISGEGMSPLIEIYSGENFELLARITPFCDVEDFEGEIQLAVGDANGDNFEDIYVTGGGYLEIFSGRFIEMQGSLDGMETADRTAMLDEPFQPYGESYTGEIQVTSGYILQRPDESNGEPIQTNEANITTLAMDELPEGEDALKVFGVTLSAHHEMHQHGDHGDHEGMEDMDGMDGMHDGMDHDMDAMHDGMDGMDHDMEAMEDGVSGLAAVVPEIFTTTLDLKVSFTPEEEIKSLHGTFADIPGVETGAPILFVETEDGTKQIIRLQDENIPTTLDVMEGDEGLDTLVGTDGDDFLSGGGGGDLIFGEDGDDELRGNGGRDILVGGFGEDTLVGGAGRDVLIGGPDGDVFVLQRNRAVNEVEQADVILAFQVNFVDPNSPIDTIGLTGRLEFDDLILTQSGPDTIVSIANNGRILGVLRDIMPSQLNENIFVSV